MSINQSAVQRQGLRVTGGPAEPIVSAQQLADAISPGEVENFRPLLPVGYAAGVAAYQSAVAKLSPRDLTTHYTAGLDFFHNVFVPQLKQRLAQLSGGVWSFDDHLAFAAGSDVDLMTHVVEAVAAKGSVSLFPGDWFGFSVGCTNRERIRWDAGSKSDLACLCVPSVRNGHVTPEMIEFLQSSRACLLNLNLYPTLAPVDREKVAHNLNPVLANSLLSISFSRGFGLTASQLGVLLVPKSHPFCQLYAEQWNWFTYFYNRIAAGAFLDFDLAAAEEVDRARAMWVHRWLAEHSLPVVHTGTYYVKSFQVEGQLPEYLNPLRRTDVVRLCFKPPQV